MNEIVNGFSAIGINGCTIVVEKIFNTCEYDGLDSISPEKCAITNHIGCINENVNRTIAVGANTANDAPTAGGTPSGILIVNLPFLPTW